MISRRATRNCGSPDSLLSDIGTCFDSNGSRREETSDEALLVLLLLAKSSSLAAPVEASGDILVVSDALFMIHWKTTVG